MRVCLFRIECMQLEEAERACMRSSFFAVVVAKTLIDVKLCFATNSLFSCSLSLECACFFFFFFRFYPDKALSYSISLSLLSIRQWKLLIFALMVGRRKPRVIENNTTVILDQESAVHWRHQRAEAHAVLLWPVSVFFFLSKTPTGSDAVCLPSVSIDIVEFPSCLIEVEVPAHWSLLSLSLLKRGSHATCTSMVIMFSTLFFFSFLSVVA